MSHWLVTVSVNTLFCQVFWLTNVCVCVCVCVCMGFPDSSVGKESACNPGDPSLIPGLRRSAGEGKGYCVCQHLILPSFLADKYVCVYIYM